jgi:hypothetical protein
MLFIVRIERPDWSVRVNFPDFINIKGGEAFKTISKSLLKIDYQYIAGRLDFFVHGNSHCSSLHSTPASTIAASSAASSESTATSSKYLFLGNFFQFLSRTESKDKIFAAR